jgi:hypothetical protein
MRPMAQFAGDEFMLFVLFALGCGRSHDERAEASQERGQSPEKCLGLQARVAIAGDVGQAPRVALDSEGRVEARDPRGVRKLDLPCKTAIQPPRLTSPCHRMDHPEKLKG